MNLLRALHGSNVNEFVRELIAVYCARQRARLVEPLR